jgi:hypothetical protein
MTTDLEYKDLLLAAESMIECLREAHPDHQAHMLVDLAMNGKANLLQYGAED